MKGDGRIFHGWGHGVLFTALGLLSWLMLSTYTDVKEGIREVIGSPWAAIFMTLLFNAFGFFTLRIATWLNDRYILNGKKRWKLVLMYIPVMMSYFLLNYGSLVMAKWLAGREDPLAFRESGVRLLIILWCVEMVILGLVLVNRAMAQVFQYRQTMAGMQEENISARYAALVSQLNPHFLFNSFNTLVSEIEYDPAEAVLFTRRLSDVYRYVLQVQSRKLVTLGEELSFLSAYLFLHQVRLGDSIRSSVEISEEQRGYRLPTLSLQLLIENAIKHNSISAAHPMDISLRIEEQMLVVSNTLRPKSDTDSTGTGLSNLSNRCKMITGRDISVVRGDNLFTVKVPLFYE